MKILEFTYRRLALFLLSVITIWSVLFYFTIMDEIGAETNKSLRDYAQILKTKALADPTMLKQTDCYHSYYWFHPISLERAKNYKDKYYDTSYYVKVEDDGVPVRVLQTSFISSDNKGYELNVMVSTMERDAMKETLVIYLLFLFLLFVVITSVGVRMVLRRVFHPLTQLVNWLHSLHPSHPVPPLQNNSPIREIRDLSDAAVAMGNRSYCAYEEQKQFIENASHELQTPLAVIRGKVELLGDSDNLRADQMAELHTINKTLSRAIKLNKSLLLLSRIDNKQYADKELVDMNEEIDSIVPDLMDIYEHKHIHLAQRKLQLESKVMCNPMLAQILVSNLVKNAIVHGPSEGKVCIETAATYMEVRNSGTEPLDETCLFKRFGCSSSKAKPESTGLGLAIAHSIAEVSGMSLTYRWENEQHCFKLTYPA